MINKEQVKQYCKDYEKIENYQKAINDDTQVWCCHHRLETETSEGEKRPRKAQLSHKELKALGMYYDRPSSELIFLTRAEHFKIHRTFESNEDFGSWKEDEKSYHKSYDKTYYEVNKEKIKDYSKIYGKAYRKTPKGKREHKISEFIRRNGTATDLSKLPKTWSMEDIEYYKTKI